MRVLLIHNEGAGEGDHRKKELVRAIEDAGYEVEWQSRKEGKWQSRLAAEIDLVVAAGGDGTVADVLLHAGVTPVAIFPLGSSNNIAASLGIAGEPDKIAASWKTSRMRPLDGLQARIRGEERLLAEGAGVGPLARSIVEAKAAKPESKKWTVDEKLDRYRANERDAPPFPARLVADGREIEDEELRSVEVVNYSRIGPGDEIAPDADPFDGRLDLVWRSREGARERRKVERVVLTWSGAPFHADDEAEEAGDERLELAIEVAAGAFRILAPA